MVSHQCGLVASLRHSHQLLEVVKGCIFTGNVLSLDHACRMDTGLNSNFPNQNIDSEMKLELDRIVRTKPTFPAASFQGRGIVTAGGGPIYFICAWVLVRMLRQLGSELPIQLWYLGPTEISQYMISLLSPYDVTCVDAFQHLRTSGTTTPAARLSGWMLKQYAIEHSPFKDVLWLDSDIIPTVNPDALFEQPEFTSLGAVFWPDRWWECSDEPSNRLLSPRAWEVCGLRVREEPEFESGQILIDKSKTWHALHVSSFLNSNADYYYNNGFHGDKDTFHLAWILAGSKYAMPPYRPKWWPVPDIVLYQHDFQGNIIFQHRTCKWTLGHNLLFAGMQYEWDCLRHISELRALWDGRVQATSCDLTEEEAVVRSEVLKTRWFAVHIPGRAAFGLEIKPDGGAAVFEPQVGKHARWWLESNTTTFLLCIALEGESIRRFRHNAQNEWHEIESRLDRVPAVITPFE
jgi:hypothetical protein